MKSVGRMVMEIEKLTNKETFWEDVRHIVGYYNDSVFIEDWDIKHLQRVADRRYENL